MSPRRCDECGGEMPPHLTHRHKRCSETCSSAARQKRAQRDYEKLKSDPARLARKREATNAWSRDRSRNPEYLKSLRDKYHTDEDYRRRAITRSSADRKIRYHRETYGKLLTTPEEIIAHSKDRYRHARAMGYRSGLEVAVARQLEGLSIPFRYEPGRISYTQPVKVRHYTPDYILPNGIVVETKGIFTTEDRGKHLHIKASHPLIDLRFVFANPNTKIGKLSKTTYAAWCNHNGFKWSDKTIPQAWIDEAKNFDSLDAIAHALKQGN